MTTLAWPAVSVDPNRFEWWLQANVQEHVSPLTGAVLTQELPGAYWAARVEYYNLGEADNRLMWAFVGNMRGRVGRVYLPNFGRPAPQGVGGGTPLVAGAGQTGASLNVDGGPLSTSGWLVAGDFVGLAGKLYLCTASAATDGAGAATLSLSPPILVAPADDAPLTLTSPTITAMFTGDRQGWTYEPGLSGRHSWTFDLREVL